MDTCQWHMFDHIQKQLFLTLINKRKYQEKFEDADQKSEFRILPEK